MATVAETAHRLEEERPAGRAIVRVEGAARRYAGGRGAGPVDLEVLGGEVLALMGPNGAGKSTLLHVLASADRPTSGRITWWGSGKASRARRQIGYAADEPVEEATLSTRQSTHFWCRQWVSDGPTARALTDQVLAELGLAGRADEPVGTLSYGLRRRLALAQALVHQPALALLDEPSAGLDPEGVEAVAATLRTRAATGRTTVVASNDPEFVALAADRVAMLHEGRCLRVAPLAILLAEVPRRRIVELRVGAGAPSLVAAGVAVLPGVSVASREEGVLILELEEEVSLGRLVAAAESVGAGVQGLEVRRPDLRDCFGALTAASPPHQAR